MSDYGNMGEDIGKLVNFLLWAIFLLGLMLVFACCTSYEFSTAQDHIQTVGWVVCAVILFLWGRVVLGWWKGRKK